MRTKTKRSRSSSRRASICHRKNRLTTRATSKLPSKRRKRRNASQSLSPACRRRSPTTNRFSSTGTNGSPCFPCSTPASSWIVRVGSPSPPRKSPPTRPNAAGPTWSWTASAAAAATRSSSPSPATK
uniref:(northern house mosquito) hypothetical protein n=1 Tax=Culex pipiens TaxID=7175 RepID=A0A8D8FRG4_CULPI